ncbi:MAG: hypothetical protein ACFFFT_01925 [Candidatus Thorarchaeota archaeon]
MSEDKKKLSLEKWEVEKRLKNLQDLDIEITWDAFFITINEYTKAKIKDNYLIPYARYLEEKLRDLLPELRSLDFKRIKLEMALYRKRRSAKNPLKVYERIDDKVDINYICDLERRMRDFHTKILLLKTKNEKLKLELQKKLPSIFKAVEFKVNDFLALKLEGNRTFIYIKGKRFIQCIRLFLQIPPQTSNLYEEIESIDEATEVYKQALWENRIVEGPMARPSRFQNRSITPEQEFWGHCSNIQAWAEHDYDTRLIHSNLAFQLLRELAFEGDAKAKAMFEEEIAIRFESGYFSVVAYLLEEGYLFFLNKDKLKTLLENNLGIENRFLENKNVLMDLGAIHIKIDNYSKAVKMLEKSLEIDPKSTRALLLIGIVYGIIGDHRKASESFKQVIQNFKNLIPKIIKEFGEVSKFWYFELAFYGLILSKIRLNKYLEIFALYTSLLKQPKTLFHAHKTIIDIFKQLVKFNLSSLLPLIEYGYIYYMNEEELKGLLENVTELPPPQFDNEISLTNYGFVNILIGDFTKAKYVLKLVFNRPAPENNVSSFPIWRTDSILPLFLLGIAYGCLNQHEKAMQSFKKVFDLDETYDIAWFGIGLSYTNSEEYIRLIKLLTREHLLAFNRFPIKVINFYRFHGAEIKNENDLHKKWYKKTINALESFIQMNPDNAIARRDLDKIYHISGMKDRDKAKFQLASIDTTLKGKSNDLERVNITDEEIAKLDLESVRTQKLMKKYQEQTDKYAIWRGTLTEGFKKWLKAKREKT